MIDLQQITIQPFPTSSRHETCLMEYSGRYFEIGKDVARLITYLQQNGCGEESIARYVRETGRYSEGEIQSFLETLSRKIGEESDDSDKKKAFLYNKDLLPADMVGKCSSILKGLFHPWVMIPSVLLFGVLDAAYFLQFQGVGSERLNMNLYLVIGLLLFFVLSSLFHEMGHASACRYFGVPHGNIGFGLYINIPVFYTDVSNVWKLPRKQRCVVNVGGVYFQIWLLIRSILCALHPLTCACWDSGGVSVYFHRLTVWELLIPFSVSRQVCCSIS